MPGIARLGVGRSEKYLVDKAYIPSLPSVIVFADVRSTKFMPGTGVLRT